MRISKDTLIKLKEMIDDAETIGITSHVNPDGDNLGSSLSFARSLRLYGKDTDVIGHDKIADYLKFMPDISMYKDSYKDSYDLFIVLDASELDRIGSSAEIFLRSKKTVVIDHHVKGSIKGDLNIIFDDAPATCELIFEIIEKLDLPIDHDVATLLYTGILTDTGRFLYSNVTEYTFKVAGALLRLGADKEYIYRNLYQSKPINVLQFETDLIKESKFFDDRVFTLATIKKTEEYGVDMSDSESVVNTLRDLKGIDISMMLKEYDNREYKVSLRSKDTDVSKVARKFGGGGHIRASGFSLYKDNLEEAVIKALEILMEI